LPSELSPPSLGGSNLSPPAARRRSSVSAHNIALNQPAFARILNFHLPVYTELSAEPASPGSAAPHEIWQGRRRSERLGGLRRRRSGGRGRLPVRQFLRCGGVGRAACCACSHLDAYIDAVQVCPRSRTASARGTADAEPHAAVTGVKTTAAGK
jgi:hypothetical protein